MIYGLWSSAAGGMVHNLQVDTIANNLANVETTGFRRDLMVFRGRIAETREDALNLHQINPVLDRIGGGLFADRTYWEKSQGAVVNTGRPLDVGIDGAGYFAVRKNDRTYYTRAGNFTVDVEGRLLTADGGGEVLTSGGSGIRIGQPSAVTIGPDGQVAENGEGVGTLALVDFPDPDRLEKVGDSLFEYKGEAVPQDGAGTLVQAALERSNVSVVEEMARMITALRAYESSMQMIRMQDETLARTVNDVGRVSG